jgi:hypothetical protein
MAGNSTERIELARERIGGGLTARMGRSVLIDTNPNGAPVLAMRLHRIAISISGVMAALRDSL